MSNKILLVGTGVMAKEYVKVLVGLNVQFDTVGRSEVGVEAFNDDTGQSAFAGGLDLFIEEKGIGSYSHFIVVTSVVSLYDNVFSLVRAGATSVLVEKPCVLNQEQLDSLSTLSKDQGAEVFIAYNRRFLSSVIKAKEIVEQDGGLEMVKFDFTEWSHVIGKMEKNPLEKERWLLANSTHIIDLAFYFAGKPVEMSAYVEGGLDWHPAGQIFTGAGKTDAGVLFSYGSDWGSAGRWWVELFTKERKLILCPVEQLKEVRKGTIAENGIELDYEWDNKYKPGLYLQTKAYLEEKTKELKSLCEVRDIFSIYLHIAGYD